VVQGVWCQISKNRANEAKLLAGVEFMCKLCGMHLALV
jgi:hypothetical protein